MHVAISLPPMKPRVKIASAQTPDGGDMVLWQHDCNFSIKINNHELMNSREHESELELARLGCAHLVKKKAPRVLIGGLGMGYTLRQTLDMLAPEAEVVVGELLDSVVEWNREFFGDLNGQALADERVEVVTGDVVKLISDSENRFDAILLDIDNGPSAMTDSGNNRLYGRTGMRACAKALRRKGLLAIWSAEPNKEFEQLLMRCRFKVSRFRASAYEGSKAQSRFVWVASEDASILPPGGGAPRPEPKSKPKRHWRRDRERR
jgi:spermidine synthase